MGMRWCRLILAVTVGLSSQAAGELSVGFLAAARNATTMGKEAAAAWSLAQRIASAKLILVPSDGAFVDDGGEPVDLGRSPVLWYREFDRPAWHSPGHATGA